MLPTRHLAISAVLAGAGFAATRSMPFAAGILAGGFLIDGDHLPETYLALRHDDVRHAWLPLHSYEVVAGVIAVGVMTWKRQPYVLGLGLGMLSHVVTDHVSNGVRPLTYFLSYRAAKGFKRLSFDGLSHDEAMRAAEHTPGWRWLRKRLGPKAKGDRRDQPDVV